MPAHAHDKTPVPAERLPRTRRAPSPAAPSAAARPGTGERPALLALQRAAGNAAVARMLEEARHQHSDHCGHRSAPDEAAVQRSAVDEVLRGSGTPLAEPVRKDMEARMGADFSDVRLHTGADARRSAEALGARAYTMGSHVVIGDGGGDRHTLAHELTHVVQQRRGPVAGTDNGQGLKVSSPSDRFEQEAEANATRVLGGPAPAPRPAEDAAAAGPGAAPALQRSVDYSKGRWSRENLPPDRFAELLEKAAPGEQRGATFAVPYAQLLRALEQSSITVEIDDQTSYQGARAKFVIDDLTAQGGVLHIKPPPAGAPASALREFAATVAHEMQHALDSVTRAFKVQTPKQTMKERWISSELRAFGTEAAAAFKLAVGDSYPASEGKPSAIIRALPDSRLSSERKQLALEFHQMDSYLRAAKEPLDAFGSALSVDDSALLNRLAGYLRVYRLVEQTPTCRTALEWLRSAPAVEAAGLRAGIELFHDNRPQVDRSR
ncbi:DUF4157 domain-containing protein [Streptomyces sp. NPDC057197]|uniref:eCIS core domain-containing protein n=1 Tax=Streptomyces sp. NPDC057197 TaxID=3346045 RepID=UPI00362B72C1